MTVANKYQSIFETVIDGIIVINDRGVIEDINPTALDLFGYESGEVIGKNVSFLMPPPDSEQHDQYIKRYQKTRKPRIIGIGREVEGLKKDGSTFPFRLAVSEYSSFGSVFYTGIIHDLTQQKKHERFIREYSEKLEEEVTERTVSLQKEIALKEQAQQALRESQKLYETIAVNFPNGSISVLNPEFEIIFIEGSELKAMGYNTSNLIGRNYIDLLPSDVKDMVLERLNLVLGGEEQSFQFSQNNRVYRARCVPVKDENGKVNQLVMVEINITKEKRAEEEIYNALQKEKQLNELKSRFVSMASHEFRTPLSSILSSAGLIARYTESDQQNKREKHIQKIKSNVRNLTEILNDFLSLQKIEEGILKNKPVQTQLKPLIAEVIEDAMAFGNSGQKIQVEYLGKDLLIVDPFLLKNVLNNLLSNAVKYSEKDVLIRVEEWDSKWTFQVIDSGIGISKEDQEMLFGRFFRASNAGSYEGTGLGLNIVKRYLEIMGGSIQVESQLNQGSTFILQLHEQTQQ